MLNMIFYRYNSNQTMPFRTKFTLIFVVFAGLTILAIFAFTFFLIALVGGTILFILNFVRGKRNKTFNISNKFGNNAYKNTVGKDVIDI